MKLNKNIILNRIRNSFIRYIKARMYNLDSIAAAEVNLIKGLYRRYTEML